MNITIISGTNRKNSSTRKIAETYQQILHEQGVSSRLLLLDEHDMTHRNDHFVKIEREMLIPADAFIFILPEYNGSYPGILKLMIDHTDIEKVWWYKQALLTGVSSGRAGNLRGMEHLTGSLLYLKMQVHHNRLPISLVHTLFSEDGKLVHAPTLEVIRHQLKQFLND